MIDRSNSVCQEDLGKGLFGLSVLFVGGIGWLCAQ
jgi:hypothetical protein